MSRPKALRRRARSYLSELCRSSRLVEFHSCFCSPFTFCEFVAAAANFSSNRKRLRRRLLFHAEVLLYSYMDLRHIFNLSWSLHSFPFIWKSSFVVPIHKMKNLANQPLHFGLFFSVSQSCLISTFYLVYSSFWSQTFFSLPVRLLSTVINLLLIKFFFFLTPFRMGITSSCGVAGRFLPLSIFPKLLTRTGIPLSSTNLFLLAFSCCVCLLDILTPSFLSDWRACMVFKNYFIELLRWACLFFFFLY